MRTVSAAIQFKKDLEKVSPILKKYFEGYFLNTDVKTSNIYYSILYNSKNLEPIDFEFNGIYFQYKILNYYCNFIQLDIDDSNFRSWYLSDTPIAVLCLHLHEVKQEDLSLLIFEIDLMIAAGFTLVLCISNFSKFQLNDFQPLIEILYEHQFAEIHITYDSDKYNVFFDRFIQAIILNYDKFHSYFYIYARYFKIIKNIEELNIPLIIDESKEHENIRFILRENENDRITKLINSLKKLETKSFCKITYFSDAIKDSLINFDLKEDPFIFCSNGFDLDKIKIILTDVPLFDNEDEYEQSFSCDFANVNYHSFCYIESDDFIFLGKTRVKVYFNNINKIKNLKIFDLSDGKPIEKYVNFDDIHYTNPELYINNQLSLCKTKAGIKSKCNSFIRKLSYKSFKPTQFGDIKINKKQQFQLREKEDISKFDQIFISALYNYKIQHDKNNKEKFQFHISQIYCAYEILLSCFNNKKKVSGSVYQVPTGEGKSAIIFLISAVLAKLNKTVHIVTSNIVLANRDYNDSFDFFKNCGLTSTALLHYNEKPIFDKFHIDPNLRQDHYFDEFFGEQKFANSLNINFDACKKNQIVFSTISNFECYYLYMTEKQNGNIDEYYKNSVLLIDEADSILIDELTNGTIISKPMKSNSKKVLQFVYDEYLKDKEVNSDYLLPKIKDKFSECVDLNEHDIDEILKEINLVENNNDFVQGKKYLIVNSFKKDKDGNPKKEIVPFDFDNKGILEKNKEYSGFIEQLITLKEKRNKPEIKFHYKDISLNYLYISHPIYINLYKNVFGLTGTIGDSNDQNLFLNHYKLKSKFMPKRHPNRCYHFPTTICDDIETRNKYIIDELMEFHKNGFPVLVILYGPDEIKVIEELIEELKKNKKINKKQKIRIYEGQDIKNRPNNYAGKKGAISLGTNVCGRGTHIEVDEKHLHVIVSFYSSNQRALQQAFGRTARKDNFGSVHIISLKEDFNPNINKMENDEIDFNLQKMKVLNEMQKQFIDEFRQKRSWIFDLNLNYTKKLCTSDRQNLRNTHINVNRSKACEYKFPICMDYLTYIDIQTQKIFSLINCPNCKYTWQLFQQYVREMILQSWSLFLNKLEKVINSESTKISEIKFHIENGKKLLREYLKAYLPEDNDDKLDIYNTFYNIYNNVNQRYESVIKSSYKSIYPWQNSDMIDYNKIKNALKLSRIYLGFRPFSILRKAGSKLRELLDKEPGVIYITDPELKYKRSTSNGDNYFSITNVLDEIFDKICNICNDFLENKINFSLFLRRTLVGCEFGLCYDLDIEIDDPNINKIKNFLFDKNILFVFSIYINSTIPFLAGVLMFMVLYFISIIKNLICAAKKAIKNLTVTGLKLISALINFVKDKVTENIRDSAIENIASFIRERIFETIEKFRDKKDEYYFIIKMLTEILVDKIKDEASDRIDDSFIDQLSKMFKKKFIKIGRIHRLFEKEFKFIFRIGFLSVLWLASHMINFNSYFLFEKKLTYSSTVEKDSYYFKTNHSEDKVDFYIKKNETKVFVSKKINLEISKDLQMFIDEMVKGKK